MPLPAPLSHQPPLWVWFLVGTFELVIRLIALGVVPKRSVHLRQPRGFYSFSYGQLLAFRSI